jgi:hypothetical protein
MVRVQRDVSQDGLLMKCLVMEMLTLRQDTETRNVLYIHEQASAAATIVILSNW